MIDLFYMKKSSRELTKQLFNIHFDSKEAYNRELKKFIDVIAIEFDCSISISLVVTNINTYGFTYSIDNFEVIK